MSRRQVPIEIRVRTVVTVPEDWTDEHARFHYVENHCTSNEIGALAERDPDGICSLCGDTEVVMLDPAEHGDLLERYREQPLFKEPE